MSNSVRRTTDFTLVGSTVEGMTTSLTSFTSFCHVLRCSYG